MANEYCTQYPALDNNPDRVHFGFRLPIGAAAAPGTQQYGGAGWTFTRTGAGAYSFTFPKVVGLTLQIRVESAAATVQDVILQTLNLSTGAGTFVTTNGAGVATDPASGDALHFMGIVKFKGVD